MPTTMRQRYANQWLPLVILAAALVIWAGLFALGAYLELERRPAATRLPQAAGRFGHDGGVSLALWGLVLWKRAGRSRRK